MTSKLAASRSDTVRSLHTFHIPVMGTGFSIDTPVRVAKYGIASVISLVDDALIEQVRKYYCERLGEPFEAITNAHPDPRAARITLYLDLVARLVEESSNALRASPFEPGSEITRYYEMLPDTSIKRLYGKLSRTHGAGQRAAIEDELRTRAVPGSIDVNIMTKLDCENWWRGEKRPPEFSDAMAALRGFARSSLHSSVVFSAGLNASLYSYIAAFPDFFPDKTGYIKKRITLKVSDFRSAAIQGKFLARKGLWVSEFRVESGINCGGHAFPTHGYLLGPILEEFKQKRAELLETLHATFNSARETGGLKTFDNPLETRVTVQGGIGTASEQELLLKYYNVDGTGWGTPFLLAPDVTNVDEEHLQKLLNCKEGDVYLSDSSPMGIPFWNLRTSASEEARRARIAAGHPGSACPKGYLRFDTTYGPMPVCLAADEYQQKRLPEIEKEDIPDAVRAFKRDWILNKACICDDLGGSVSRTHGLGSNVPPAICCGPNIEYFKKILSLEELAGHIYGRISVLCTLDRPHVFIQEIRLYLQHLRDQIRAYSMGLLSRTPKYFEEFAANLAEGIQYYRMLSRHIVEEQQAAFTAELARLQQQLEGVVGSAPASDQCP